MTVSIGFAEHNLGRVWPNPAVGCTIVRRDGKYFRIVGQGRTQPEGGAHAEVSAIAEAGENARGATLYTTLEPCAHHGRTPPCVDAIIAAGIHRVVSAMTDPDRRVCGRGHARILSAGIALECGILEDLAQVLNIGHIKRVCENRPFVTVKLAHSPSGHIAGAGGMPVRITGYDADLWVHRMRSRMDAIMVGLGTLQADDPRLTCRFPGMEDRSPVRIVLDDGNLGMDLASQVFQTARQVPTWIITGSGPDHARLGGLEREGVKVFSVSRVVNGHLDLSEVLQILAGKGIGRLLVEGGATLARSFLEEGLADEFNFIEGKTRIDDSDILAFRDEGIKFIERSPEYMLADMRALGSDTLRRYVRRQ